MDVSARPRPRPVRGVLDLLSPSRTLVMGVLNATPDSFSDGGHHHAEGDPGPAIARGLALVAAGADLVDVGGESTRPGAQRVPAEVEAARVLPVVEALAAAGVVVSVDTTRASLARAAVDAGAAVVNDVSGGLQDPGMAAAAARTGAVFVASHWRGPSAVMNDLARYDDEGGVLAAVLAGLRSRIGALADAGLDPARVVLDPGLGFAKRAGHDLALLGALDQVIALGRPVLVGASRKRFLGAVLAGAGADGEESPVPPALERDDATAAVTALAAAAGAWAVRVHEPRASADAVRVVAAVRAAAPASAADPGSTTEGEP